jgi:hypothetical protein
MDTTTQNKQGCITALVFVTILSAMSLSYFLGSQYTKEPIANNNAAELIATYVVDMPESALRSNLLTVFGAEYNGSSQELNEILKSYANMKIKELNEEL